MTMKQYHLYLKGFVGGCDFDSGYVDYVLDKHKNEEVTVLINSLGGSVATALSIASAFHRHGNVAVHFAGMNASAATIAALGAKTVTIEASAMYLVHKCSMPVFEWGNLNADELDRLIDGLHAQKCDLEKIDENVAQMYGRRTKRCKDELLDLMRKGGWLNAEEARSWGFVDEVTEDVEPAPVLTDEVATALAAEGIPIPDIPVAKKDSAWGRFITAISGLVQGRKASETDDDKDETPINNLNTPVTMKKNYAAVCALLAIEAFTAEDEKIILTTDQMQAIEDRLAAMQQSIDAKETELTARQNGLATKSAEVTQLQAEVAALKKQPGEESGSVIEDKGHAGKSDMDEFIDTVNKASELFNALP